MRGELTPTEQRILELLDEGLHDAEIAVRIGVPVGDVKQRITAMLQREHLLDREALLAWHRGAPAADSHPVVNRGGLPLRLRPWFVPAVASAAFATGLLVALGFTWPSGDSAAQAEPTPTRTPRGTIIIATVVPAEGGFQPPLNVGNAVTIDAGFAPIVITYPATHAASDGPITIDRLYLDPETNLVVREQIWEQPEGGLIYDAITNDLGTLLAVEYADGDGAQWIEVLTVGGERLGIYASESNNGLVTFVGNNVVVNRGGSLNPFSIAGSNEGFDAPGTAFGDPLGWLPETGLLWYEGQGYVLDDKGNRVFRLGAGVTHELRPLAFGVFRDDGLIIEARIQAGPSSISNPGVVSFDEGVLVAAWQPEAEPPYTSFISLRDGNTFRTAAAAFFPLGSASALRMVGTICDGRNGCDPDYNPGQPAVVTLRDGRLSELAGISDNRRLIGSQRGPFARVFDGAECWPIRNSLELRDETILWCAQPGEPLTLYDLQPVERYYPGEPTIGHSDGGLDYVRVLAPSGAPGWIRLDAVEMGPFPEPGR